MTVFEQAFKVVVGEEGGFTADPADPGNWTGGRRGLGIRRGTKYGISASAHPHLDIASLTLEQARTIYQGNYWNAVQGDDLPPALALLVFDTAVNCGTHAAVRWLQDALACRVDGEIGLQTIAAAQAASSDLAPVCAHFQALRLVWMTTLPTWHTFGLGWARRLCSLPYSAMKMELP